MAVFEVGVWAEIGAFCGVGFDGGRGGGDFFGGRKVGGFAVGSEGGEERANFSFGAVEFGENFLEDLRIHGLLPVPRIWRTG